MLIKLFNDAVSKTEKAMVW